MTGDMITWLKNSRQWAQYDVDLLQSHLNDDTLPGAQRLAGLLQLTLVDFRSLEDELEKAEEDLYALQQTAGYREKELGH